MSIFFPTDADLHFPDSDGKPMADNTEQFRWIVLIKENLEILFADDPNVFVAGDLLWYPVKSRLISPVAPDIMVVFGRPKGRRGSYKQWQEDNIAPQVVYEILSPSNNVEEMERKLEFYQTYGVEEYYQYDPDRYELKGWQRQEEQLLPIAHIDGWTSPRLGIRFVVGNHELEIYRPDERRFLSSVELSQRAEQERQRAEQERQRAEQAEQQLQDMQALLQQYRDRFGELDR
ncbi:MAG: Uma2 family endonuclease [Calothrix sp. MO_167.B12]|nr:Uma2 family endonuclease [Calothrix sp. MO_167.B12]